MTIVVGVDGSAESTEALRWAIAEARLRGTNVRVLNACHFPAAMATSHFLGGRPVSEPLLHAEQFHKHAERLLEHTVSDVAGDDAGVRIDQTVIEGHPSEALVTAANDADLLVVGSRGHGGFAGLLLGSVSQACAHHANCPVVIIRRRDGR